MPNRRQALRLFCPTGPPTLTHPPPTGAITGKPTLTHPPPTGAITGDSILTYPPPPLPTGATTGNSTLTLHLQPEATTGNPTQKILKNILFASNTTQHYAKYNSSASNLNYNITPILTRQPPTLAKT
jgi:hypothetical protein